MVRIGSYGAMRAEPPLDPPDEMIDRWDEACDAVAEYVLFDEDVLRTIGRHYEAGRDEAGDAMVDALVREVCRNVDESDFIGVQEVEDTIREAIGAVADDDEEYE